LTAPARAGATGIALTEFRYDEWEKPPRVRDTFDVISRPGERGPDKPELTRSYELPGKHMTAEEFAEFKRKGGNWYNKARFCFRHPQRLSGWEKGFVDSLLGWKGEPTEKQFARLNAIYTRLRAQGDNS
jgi:hypothetical protein